ncbi:MAG: serine acetyltransferase [Deltaproteobacteria bacterium]|nr:MAG: serine acetyltransferase [Deltaproteobacteria bacterium]
MDDHEIKKEETCKIEVVSTSRLKERLPAIAEKIIQNCNDTECYTHVDYEPIPSKESVIRIIDKLKEILFPGYFNEVKLDPVNLKYYMGQSVSDLFEMISEQVSLSIRHDCFRYDQPCSECVDRGHGVALEFLDSIPTIRKTPATDIRATFDGDPAARSYDEIIFSYPGIFAITVYRIAHKFFEMEVPLLPRIMTEYAHNLTGIDIHPGAEIEESFVIDHGTGVVIGETTKIGKRVRIYQGVTLGALSVPKDAGNDLRGKKRHPTIEDDVIIYSGATILGGETIIGARSIIGGNVWITQSVPPDSKIILEPQQLKYR